MLKRKPKIDKILKNIDEVKKMKSQGATDVQIMKALGVSRATFYAAVKEYPEVSEALEEGKIKVVDDLVGELYRKSMPHTLTTTKTFKKNGKVTTEITTKEVDGDLGAIIFLLKNYDKEHWSNEPNMLELKRKEVELKEKALENNAW